MGSTAALCSVGRAADLNYKLKQTQLLNVWSSLLNKSTQTIGRGCLFGEVVVLVLTYC